MTTKGMKTTANRPALQRKTTPRSERARTEALDKGIAISVNGKTYTVRMGDLNADHARAMRLEFGMPFTKLMTTEEDDWDLDMIAAIVWLARRIDGETRLKYAEVAEEIGYDTDIDVVDPDAAEAASGPVVEGEVVEDPEA